LMTGFYLWLRWYLGEGEFKPYGRKYRPLAPKRRPDTIGRSAGLLWWARYAVFMAARLEAKAPPPPPPPPSVFELPGMYVAWGLKSGQWTSNQLIDAAKSRGYGWVCLETDDFENDARIDALVASGRAVGIKVGAWETNPSFKKWENRIDFYVAELEKKINTEEFAYW
jgi:hypothetical protein